MDFDMQLWTPESQTRWRDRTDAGLYFLTQAQDNVWLMMRLDKEAVGMGLSATFKADDLGFMLEDVSTKTQMLARHRNRIGE